MRRFEWDEEKDRTNRRKHGIAFEDAIRIFDGPRLEDVDDRSDYGEMRMTSVGLMNAVVIVAVAHVDRGEVTRIITARRATRKERRLYEQRFL